MDENTGNEDPEGAPTIKMTKNLLEFLRQVTNVSGRVWNILGIAKNYFIKGHIFQSSQMKLN